MSDPLASFSHVCSRALQKILCGLKETLPGGDGRSFRGDGRSLASLLISAHYFCCKVKKSAFLLDPDKKPELEIK